MNYEDHHRLIGSGKRHVVKRCGKLIALYRYPLMIHKLKVVYANLEDVQELFPNPEDQQHVFDSKEADRYSRTEAIPSTRTPTH